MYLFSFYSLILPRKQTGYSSCTSYNVFLGLPIADAANNKHKVMVHDVDLYKDYSLLKKRLQEYLISDSYIYFSISYIL